MYEFTVSTAIASTCPPLRRSMPAVRQCQGSVEMQAPVLAEDDERLVLLEDQPAVEVRKHVAGEAQRSGEGDVDPVAAEHLLAMNAQRLAAQHPCRVDAVAADIHQRPAAQLAAQPRVAGVVDPEAEARANDARSDR